MFDKLVWHADRMLLGDLVFRLQHYANDNWELGNDCFLFYKIKYLVDQYAKFWSLRGNFHARNILELGMWDGGSVAFWFEYFNPEKHVGVDVQQKEDSPYFKRYKSSRGLEQRIRTYWGIDQGDSAKLRDIVQVEFHGPLDLVIDDASHMYDLTKKGFETLFPLLRPGGLYIIEDWAWGHWPEFQTPDHPWFGEIPLTRLIFELTAATGSCRIPWVSSISIFQGFAVIEHGETPSTATTDFKLDALISGCGISPEPRVAKSKILRTLRGWVS
jgi:SAM-dependent methyltransferase